LGKIHKETPQVHQQVQEFMSAGISVKLPADELAPHPVLPMVDRFLKPGLSI
jgi:hypothetical protein